MTRKNCRPSAVAKYKGIYAPRCNAGAGCDRCDEKYRQAQEARSK